MVLRAEEILPVVYRDWNFSAAADGEVEEAATGTQKSTFESFMIHA